MVENGVMGHVGTTNIRPEMGHTRPVQQWQPIGRYTGEFSCVGY